MRNLHFNNHHFCPFNVTRAKHTAHVCSVLKSSLHFMLYKHCAAHRIPRLTMFIQVKLHAIQPIHILRTHVPLLYAMLCLPDTYGESIPLLSFFCQRVPMTSTTTCCMCWPPSEIYSLLFPTTMSYWLHRSQSVHRLLFHVSFHYAPSTNLGIGTSDGAPCLS